MLRLLRALFGHDCPTRREMMATRDAFEALDARVDNHYRELRELRGRVNAMRRWEAKADQNGQQTAEDAPGSTNGDEIDRLIGLRRGRRG